MQGTPYRLKSEENKIYELRKKQYLEIKKREEKDMNRQ